MNKYWFYKLLSWPLRSKYKAMYKREKVISVALEKNNFILVKENGERVRNPHIEGLTVEFYGENSTVEIHEPCSFQNSLLRLSNNNYVKINETHYQITNFQTPCVMRENSQLIVGKELSCVGCLLYMHDEPGVSVSIGNDCMFSFDVIIWPSDGHAIVTEGGHCINKGENIVIGNHVWLGMGAKILKGAVIPDNSIVAMSSVFLKNSNPTAIISYTPPHSTIFAGVPAKAVKRGNFYWVRENCYDYTIKH